METNFQTRELTLLLVGGVLFIFSLVLFVQKRIAPALVLLVLTGFLLRLTFVLTDPFLHDWDEQFHALVARNMTEHPFKPMLFKEPIMPYAISDWSQNHVWLHKQPLFLWLIAGSIKVFGITPFAVKFPSLLLSSLMIPAIYRIGKLIYTEATGYYAAMLLTFCYISIDVITGSINTDHNDVIFAAFVLFSIWAFCEYAFGGKSRMRWYVGLFAGCAVLVKWLPGLLVFAGWGVWLLLDTKARRNKQMWKDLIIGFVVASIVLLPWQIYTHVAFPEESAYELQYSARHFTEPIEGHQGPWNYHLLQLRDSFGEVLSYLFALGWLLLLIVAKNRIAAWATFSMLLGLFVFYTLAATKMPLFTLPVYPLLLLGGAVLIDLLLRQVIENKLRAYFVATPLLITLCWFFLQLDKLEERHTSLAGENSFREKRMHDRKQSVAVASDLGAGKWAVFGLYSAIPFQFYTGIPAHPAKPNQERINELQKHGWRIAIYDPEAKDSLPQGVYRITRKFKEE